VVVIVEMDVNVVREVVISVDVEKEEESVATVETIELLINVAEDSPVETDPVGIKVKLVVLVKNEPEALTDPERNPDDEVGPGANVVLLR